MTPVHNDPFVPLTAAAPKAGERQEFRVTVVRQPEGVQPFRSLEPKAPAAAGAAAAPRGPGCEPRVSVQREAERVTGIRVQCTCGQVIDLACVYQEPAK
jgi:hypothetical protein